MADDRTATTPSRWDDPRTSGIVMAVTYVVGGIGYAIGIGRLSSGDPAGAVEIVALLSVGVEGVLSAVRHSLLHRSDAVRMGWDLGRRNEFQIEVGFANLAIGLVALAAVGFDWGTTAVATVTLVYALYFLQVAVLAAVSKESPRHDRFRRLGLFAAQAALLGTMAVAALADAGVEPLR